MKQLIKFFTITGLVILVSGIGITSAAASMGGSLPGIPWNFKQLLPRIRYHLSSWGHSAAHELWDEVEDIIPDAVSDSLSRRHHPETHHAASSGDPGSSLSAASSPATQNATEFTNVRELEIDIDSGSIQVCSSSDASGITVHIQDELNRTTCAMDKETLKIKRKEPKTQSGAPQVTIFVPADYPLEEVKIDTGTAVCQLSGIIASHLEIDTGVGSVVYSGSVHGDIEVETEVGNVRLELSGSQTDYNYDIECGISSVTVGSHTYSGLSAETKINNNALYSMKLECGVGDIQVRFTDEL